MPATVPASVVLHKNWPRDGARGDSVQSGVTVRRCHAGLSAGSAVPTFLSCRPQCRHRLFCKKNWPRDGARGDS